MQNIRFPVFSRPLRARSKHGMKQKEASRTQKVFLNAWKVTIYKPVRLIHLPEMLKPSHDTLTSCKTQTHTASTVRDDHSPRASRWTVTGVFTLQPCQLVWGEEGLVYLSWFILLSCLTTPPLVCSFSTLHVTDLGAEGVPCVVGLIGGPAELLYKQSRNAGGQELLTLTRRGSSCSLSASKRKHRLLNATHRHLCNISNKRVHECMIKSTI